MDDRDNAANVPKSVVVDSSFTWGADKPLRTPWDETVIYEVHMKGLTARHPDVPEALRGTYLGMTSPAVLDHLTKSRRDRRRVVARPSFRPRSIFARSRTYELLGL